MKKEQRKKPEIRKKEIIHIALSLFLEKGYEKITMNEIASASGIAKGLCYHYFPSKEVLYQEALTNFVEKLAKDFEAIIKNRELTLEDRMDKMASILPGHKGKTLFYDFSRQQENKRVYLDILNQLFHQLIPSLSQEYLIYTELPMNLEERINTLMKFILFGQLGILTEKEKNIEEQLIQIKEYITILLQYETQRRSD